jgi:hypothetical protein
MAIRFGGGYPPSSWQHGIEQPDSISPGQWLSCRKISNGNTLRQLLVVTSSFDCLLH